jgi:catechol 2,3-dioxygenase-like lactoylglutathione lyase family enzyme
MIGRKWCFRVCLAALLVSLTGISLAAKESTEADPDPAPRPLVRIDHIPLAVRDLDRAVDTYQRLGFTIKSGRFHTDGIRNMHVKFANGAGIELITAGAPTDDLTRRYLTLLAQVEGPAFVGFYTPDLTALEGRLNQSGIPYKLDDNKPRHHPVSWQFCNSHVIFMTWWTWPNTSDG